MLAVWDIEDETVIEEARRIYNIEIWKISDILDQLMKEVKSRAYRDDVLRTIQLISKEA